MSDFPEKILIGLLSAVLGWVLSQFTPIIQEKLKTKKVIRMLLEEIYDLNFFIEKLLGELTNDLKSIYSAKIPTSSPLEIVTYFFTNHYKDALLGLNRHQKNSYQTIHILVGNINSQLRELQDLVKDSNTQLTGKKANIAKLQELTRDIYINTKILKWHIDFHLKNPHNPDFLQGTENYKEYLAIFEKFQEQTLTIAQSGKYEQNP